MCARYSRMFGCGITVKGHFCRSVLGAAVRPWRCANPWHLAPSHNFAICAPYQPLLRAHALFKSPPRCLFLVPGWFGALGTLCGCHSPASRFWTPCLIRFFSFSSIVHVAHVYWSSMSKQVSVCMGRDPSCFHAVVCDGRRRYSCPDGCCFWESA